MTTPDFKELLELIKSSPDGNTISIYKEISSDLLTPTICFRNLSGTSNGSFLLESVSNNEKIGRYSIISSNPLKVIKTGPNLELKGDPLVHLKKELDKIKYIDVKGLPDFTGGAVGYVSFDCIKYFEPVTDRQLKDFLNIPEAIFMIFDDVVIFDHIYQNIKVLTNLHGNFQDKKELLNMYTEGKKRIDQTIKRLYKNESSDSQTVKRNENSEFESNIGKEGYEEYVRKLKKHIEEGDIIQAVPSQRLEKRTDVDPFNLYRFLRRVNPAPYLFYLDLVDFQIIGASPETLVKVDTNKKVITHPIAGTRKRGKDEKEDKELEKELLNDEKEVAEHIMLVDLGRNDVNRVCDPRSVKVDRLMKIEKYSHVQHIVSEVSGILRKNKDIYDAFRSIFPAGTVSGAPKIKAIQLIFELEKESRGVYAGSVGNFGYKGTMDCCIAIRTIIYKEKTVYLQAGGGITYDSDPYSEYCETVNKLKSSATAISKAEEYYLNLEK